MQQSRLTFETLVTRLFRDRFQLRSGVVDLVIGVRDDGGRCHRLAIPGERFVGLIAEHLAEVGDGGGKLLDRPQGYEIARKPAIAAAASNRRRRSRNALSIARGVTKLPKFPESW
jgi:hypothetical protein